MGTGSSYWMIAGFVGHVGRTLLGTKFSTSFGFVNPQSQVPSRSFAPNQSFPKI